MTNYSTRDDIALPTPATGIDEPATAAAHAETGNVGEWLEKTVHEVMTEPSPGNLRQWYVDLAAALRGVEQAKDAVEAIYDRFINAGLETAHARMLADALNRVRDGRLATVSPESVKALLDAGLITMTLAGEPLHLNADAAPRRRRRKAGAQ